MSEPAETTLYALLMRVRTGGSLVSGMVLGSDELALAKREKRVYVDKDGFVYVYRPKLLR